MSATTTPEERALIAGSAAFDAARVGAPGSPVRQRGEATLRLLAERDALEAASEVERARADRLGVELTGAALDRDAALAEVARLRAALAPYAKVGDPLTEDEAQLQHDEGYTCVACEASTVLNDGADGTVHGVCNSCAHDGIAAAVAALSKASAS